MPSKGVRVPYDDEKSQHTCPMSELLRLLKTHLVEAQRALVLQQPRGALERRSIRSRWSSLYSDLDNIKGLRGISINPVVVDIVYEGILIA